MRAQDDIHTTGGMHVFFRVQHGVRVCVHPLRTRTAWPNWRLTLEFVGGGDCKRHSDDNAWKKEKKRRTIDAR